MSGLFKEQNLEQNLEPIVANDNLKLVFQDEEGTISARITISRQELNTIGVLSIERSKYSEAHDEVAKPVRSEPQLINLPYKIISRRHALLRWPTLSGSPILTDNSSTHGTRVEKAHTKKIVETTYGASLEDGDTIIFGKQISKQDEVYFPVKCTVHVDSQRDGAVQTWSSPLETVRQDRTSKDDSDASGGRYGLNPSPSRNTTLESIRRRSLSQIFPAQAKAIVSSNRMLGSNNMNQPGQEVELSVKNEFSPAAKDDAASSGPIDLDDEIVDITGALGEDFMPSELAWKESIARSNVISLIQDEEEDPPTSSNPAEEKAAISAENLVTNLADEAAPEVEPAMEAEVERPALLLTEVEVFATADDEHTNGQQEAGTDEEQEVSEQRLLSMNDATRSRQHEDTSEEVEMEATDQQDSQSDASLRLSSDSFLHEDSEAEEANGSPTSSTSIPSMEGKVPLSGQIGNILPDEAEQDTNYDDPSIFEDVEDGSGKLCGKKRSIDTVETNTARISRDKLDSENNRPFRLLPRRLMVRNSSKAACGSECPSAGLLEDGDLHKKDHNSTTQVVPRRKESETDAIAKIEMVERLDDTVDNQCEALRREHRSKRLKTFAYGCVVGVVTGAVRYVKGCACSYPYN